MRLVSFVHHQHPSFGILRNEIILDVPALFHVFGGAVPGKGTLRTFLSEATDPLGTLTGLLANIDKVGQVGMEELRSHGVLLPVDHVELKAPIPDPSKIVAVGMNYMDHCREQGAEPPKNPVLFCKLPSAITGPGASIVWDPALTRKVDFEAELGVVIAKRAQRVSLQDAMSCVLGYLPVNDVSARDLQFGDGQWIRGKSLDTFCPMGPAIVTADEVPDPHALGIRCLVNDVVFQDSNTSEMIFKIPELISFVTQGITLEPGDIISTGTPHGVGVFRKPPVYLKDGDRVSVEIEKAGVLNNTCSVR